MDPYLCSILTLSDTDVKTPGNGETLVSENVLNVKNRLNLFRRRVVAEHGWLPIG